MDDLMLLHVEPDTAFVCTVSNFPAGWLHHLCACYACAVTRSFHWRRSMSVSHVWDHYDPSCIGP